MAVQSSPINSAAYVALLRINLNRVFLQVGDERPREYPRWINVKTFDNAFDTTLQMTSLGPMGQKPEGTQFPKDSPILGGTTERHATPYGSLVELLYEAMRDEQYGTFKDFPTMQARSGREREEISAAAVLNRAFDTAYNGFTSGEALCGNHVGLDGVTRRNAPTTDIGFSVTGLQQMIMHFHGLTNERGMREIKRPRLVVLHFNDLFKAREILGSPGKPYTADNEINPVLEEDLTYFVSHFLSSTTAWFGLADKDNHDLQMGWRDRPMQDTFPDPMTMNAYTSAYQRHTDGYFNDWRGVWGTDGAA